mmetsp:Transcript_2492/g.8488  ORF Transcript_2492/g.8488 Transcript_2492/m.8488 type:complete len:276 (-) Transcript_2492:286-1113(-)
MERELRWPYDVALPKAFCFHSGTSLAASPVPLTSAASCLSPCAIGSSQGLDRSFGTASISLLCCCSLSSRLSLASADWVIAALWSDPSGTLTILMGDTSAPVAFVCPWRNGGSSSFRSTSTSSSAPSAAPPSRPSPSSSKLGYSDTGRIPLAISCFVSHLSGELMRFLRLELNSSPSSAEGLIPDKPCRPPPPPPPPSGVRFEPVPAAAAGRPPPRQSLPPPPPFGASGIPVAWSTSFMLRLIRFLSLSTERTLTHTRSSRLTTSLGCPTLRFSS